MALLYFVKFSRVMSKLEVMSAHAHILPCSPILIKSIFTKSLEDWQVSQRRTDNDCNSYLLLISTQCTCNVLSNIAKASPQQTNRFYQCSYSLVSPISLVATISPVSVISVMSSSLHEFARGAEAYRVSGHWRAIVRVPDNQDSSVQKV